MKLDYWLVLSKINDKIKSVVKDINPNKYNNIPCHFLLKSVEPSTIVFKSNIAKKIERPYKI